jgi:DNA mismatch endonuclease (patch repair protein)
LKCSRRLLAYWVIALMEAGIILKVLALALLVLFMLFTILFKIVMKKLPKKPPKEYVRDNRSPTPKHEGVSKVMSANKAKDTKPELTLRKSLWGNNIKGYRINWKKVPGRPDIAFPGKKTAIFINGCFWHRCPTCNYPLPKHNTEFWRSKFDRNVLRDERKTYELLKLGWNVIVVWECEIKNNIEKIVEKIAKQISETS